MVLLVQRPLGTTVQEKQVLAHKGIVDVCYELFFFYNCIVPVGFLPWEIRVAFPGESQLRQSCATQFTVHAGCFSVFIIHQTLTWSTGSLTCIQMLMHAIAHGVVWTDVRVCTYS